MTVTEFITAACAVLTLMGGLAAFVVGLLGKSEETRQAHIRESIQEIKGLCREFGETFKAHGERINVLERAMLETKIASQMAAQSFQRDREAMEQSFRHWAGEMEAIRKSVVKEIAPDTFRVTSDPKRGTK